MSVLLSIDRNESAITKSDLLKLQDEVNRIAEKVSNLSSDESSEDSSSFSSSDLDNIIADLTELTTKVKGIIEDIERLESLSEDHDSRMKNNQLFSFVGLLQ